MSGIFEPVHLTWKGHEYTVAADRVMRLIATLEEHVTLADLLSGRPPHARLAMAYADALRYAGAKVSEEEVYEALFQGEEGSRYTAVIQGVLMMMIPPSAVREQEQKAGKEPVKPGKKKGGKDS